MSILLAIGNPNLTEIIRQSLVEGNLDVLNNDVLHRNYLNEIIEQEKPKIVVLHDAYLPSDFAEQELRDDEVLQLVSYWRSIYDSNLRVVYLCERDRRDPFLSNLVARNVLDIFNERQISAAIFVEQLSEEPRYVNVGKFGIGELEVEFEEVPEEKQSDDALDLSVESSQSKGERTKQVLSKLSETTKSVVDAGAEWNKQRIHAKGERAQAKSERAPTQSEPKTVSEKKSSTDVGLSEILDLMPIPKEVYARTQVIGTVVIGVAGVKSHLGATHTAMSIAAFLQQRKHSVALIELNTSEDFERIHSLYEGEKSFLRNESSFNYSGIDHYKFREDIRLGEIMATYEYVVLDFGSIEDTSFYKEYLRSHVRVLIVSPYEWKQHWTDDFGKRVVEKEDFLYVVPFAEKANVRDMEERLPELPIISFPAISNPYKTTIDVEDSVSTIMTGYLKDATVSSSKKIIIVASLASALITTVVIGVFALL